MPRTSQAERRATTTRALLDATIAVLMERGHAATTTTAVVERAQVSQGALFRYFPSKADLFGATIEDVFPSVVDLYADRIVAGLQLMPQAPLEDTLIRPLLEVMELPQTRAAAELMMAARTDEDLAARLLPVQRAHRENIRRAARDGYQGLLGVPAPAALDDLVDVLVDATFGMAFMSGADDARLDAQIAMLARITATVVPELAQTPTPAESPRT